MEQIAKWVAMSVLPKRNGWYLVRYIGDKEFAMYFRTEKRSYSDSQWFVNSETGHDWKGILPDRWLVLTE